MCRFIQSRAYKFWRATGEMGYGEFGTNPTVGPDSPVPKPKGELRSPLRDQFLRISVRVVAF